jgi:hypothetical protein
MTIEVALSRAGKTAKVIGFGSGAVVSGATVNVLVAEVAFEETLSVTVA